MGTPFGHSPRPRGTTRGYSSGQNPEDTYTNTNAILMGTLVATGERGYRYYDLNGAVYAVRPGKNGWVQVAIPVMPVRAFLDKVRAGAIPATLVMPGPEDIARQI